MSRGVWLPARLARQAERAAALLFPRRCPFCDGLLGPDAAFAAVCPACAESERLLRHSPPRLPATEHSFVGLSRAMGAWYYTGAVRHAILLCKDYGRLWYARELADLALIEVFGAQPAALPGERPAYHNLTGLPLYNAIVPVPPRQGSARTSLPDIIARRLSAVLGIPVLRPLQTTRLLAPQKTLDKAQRLRNVKGAYTARRGVDLSGRRLLLVDDIITTGATVSACALALQQAGAADVSAFCLAADEELPRELTTRVDLQEYPKA